MSRDAGICTTVDADQVRIQWANRQVRRDPFLLCFFTVFLTIWVPITCWATYETFIPQFSLLMTIGLGGWSVLAWAATAAIFYSFLQRGWHESISLSARSLVVESSGLLAPKAKCIPVADIDRVTLGFHRDDDESESCVTLSVHYRTSRDLTARRLMAYWGHPALKEQIFDELQAFAAARDIPVSFERNWRMPKDY